MTRSVDFAEYRQVAGTARREREACAFSRLAQGEDTLTLDELDGRTAERAMRFEGLSHPRGTADGDVGARGR